MGRLKGSWTVAAVAVWACLCLAPLQPAFSYPFGPTVQPLEPETVVPRCADSPAPDVPVRAYRDLLGVVHVTLGRSATAPPTPEEPAPRDQSRRLSGPDLASVGPVSCEPVLAHTGSTDPDLSSYHWREWLASPYRLPGTNTVHALVHTEFHGAEFDDPDLCTYGSSQPSLGLSWCWLTALTLATSNDGGATYEHAHHPPAHLVANIPHQYEKDSGATGYRAPTNIISRTEPGGVFYYVLFDAQQFSKGAFASENRQQTGICVMRTSDLSDPDSWRAWDGNGADDGQNGFTVQFAYPFPAEPADGHVCAPINSETGPGRLLWPDFVPRSVTFNTYFDRYLLVGNIRVVDPSDGTGYFYVYYSLSTDLLDWTAPALVTVAPTLAQYRADGCSGPDVPIVYPTFIDPSDTSDNFERTGQTTYFFYRRNEDIDPDGCTNVFPGIGHKVIRVPVRLGTAREASGRPLGCPGSFDRSTGRTSATSFEPLSGPSYSGHRGSYRASAHPAARSAYGVFDRDGDPPSQCEPPGAGSRPRFGFGESDEVIYGAAFMFPRDGFWRRIEREPKAFPSVSLLRLEDPDSGDWAGMLTIDRNRRLRFSTSARDESTKKQLLGSAGVQIPRDECWHFVEVRQRFSADPARAVNEVWVDGVRRDVALADDVNHYGNGPYDELRVGIAGKANVSRRLTLLTDAAAFGYSSPRSPAHDPGPCE